MSRLRRSPRRLIRWLAGLVAALATGLGAGGCGAFGPDRPEEPRPSRSVVRDTVSGSPIGAELIVTASVAAVPGLSTMVVRDADLPRDGLLVVGAGGGPHRPGDLVTVRGRVQLFDFSDFAPRYGLSFAGPYVPFEHRRVLVADDVRSWS